MSKPVSVDFQFSIKQRGRGAKKRIVEGAAQSDESKPALERIPRISRYMALAIHFEDLIRHGVVTDYADLARLGHVTRARMTQIMNLRLLASEIQEKLLFLPSLGSGGEEVNLRDLQSIAAEIDWRTQLVDFSAVVGRSA
jgi:hypothetical protein